MASNGWKRAMHFLGLVEDYEDDYADLPSGEPLGPPPSQPDMPATPRPEPSNVRRIPGAGEADALAGVGAASSAGPAATPAPVQPTGTVNVLGGPRDEPARTARPTGPRTADHVHVTSPTAFNDVEDVGENFRDQVPVLMNLQGASETVAKRLLDFASGLIYGLDGTIDRVGDRVFLLVPSDVEVSAGELSRLRDRGLMT